jgi:hypothetical protein
MTEQGNTLCQDNFMAGAFLNTRTDKERNKNKEARGHCK